jgi:hypothetical protein
MISPEYPIEARGTTGPTAQRASEVRAPSTELFAYELRAPRTTNSSSAFCREALEQGIRVLSMSLGFRGYWEDFLPIIRILRERGAAASSRAAGARRVIPATSRGLVFSHEHDLRRLDQHVVEAEDLGFCSSHPQGGTR